MQRVAAINHGANYNRAMTDTLTKYLFEDRSVRAEAVRLSQTWRDTRAHHQHPPAITRLLGELVAASTLLAANLKFDGSLVLQLQGDGPIALIVVECRADLQLRATVKLREGQDIPDTDDLQSLLNPGGNGRFIMVLDPSNKMPGQQPYQGVVPLDGDSVAEVLEHYMQASEQLDTKLWLQADDDHVAGLLLQRLPLTGGTDAPAASIADAEETWNRACHLASTVKPGELLDTDSTTLIQRLYWEDTLIAFEPQPVRWYCPCNRSKVADMLRMLGAEEIEDILKQQETIAITCEFCGKPYNFDAVDCAGLFVGASDDGPGQSVH